MVLSPKEIADFKKGKIDSLVLGISKTLEFMTNSILAQYYVSGKPIHFCLGNLENKEIQDITTKFSESGWNVKHTICEKYGFGYFSFNVESTYKITNINPSIHSSFGGSKTKIYNRR